MIRSGQSVSNGERYMRKLFRIPAVILLFPVLMGCSIFSAPQPLAYIHIKGPGNQTKEFVLAIEPPKTEKELDLHLSDRYLLEFDLQWLWYDKEDILLLNNDKDPQGFIPPLTPWMILKYRF
jgi:hypothetical protein